MRRVRSRVPVVALVLGASLVGPAGSALGAPAAKTSTMVSVCHESSRVTAVVVTRRSYNPERFSFPVRVEGDNAMAVREFARAICALPVMPPGVYHCPAEVGPIYYLFFTPSANATASAAPTVRVDPIRLEVTGCTEVTGAEPIRRVLYNAAFYRTFGAAIGLDRATRATFLGVFLG